MIKFKSLHLQNHLLFKDLLWQLDKHPLTVIRGQNLDQKIESGNYVGKSLLPSSLTTMLTYAPPMAQKKKSAKELVFNKSHLTLELQNNKDNWKIEQFAKAKSVKYNIHLNGVDQKAVKINVAQEFIHKAVPLSEDHIFSQLYISSFRPSVMLYGQPSARLNYFEQIFDLRIYDQLRKAVLKDLQTVDQNFTKFKLLSSQKDELTPNLEKNVGKRLKVIKLRHQELLNTYAISQKAAQKLIEYVTLAEQLHSSDTYDLLKTRQKSLSKKINKLKLKVAEQQKYNAEAKAAQQQKKKRHKILARLKQMQAFPNAKQDLTTTQLFRQKYQKQIQQYNQYEAYIEKYNAIAKEHLTATLTVEPEKIQEKLTTLSYRLKQKRKLKPGKPCPLCEQKISKHLQHDLQTLQKTVSKTKRTLKKAKTLAFIQKMQNKLPKDVLELDIGHTHRKMQRVRNKESQLTAEAEQHELRKELKAELKKLPKTRVKAVKTIDYEAKLEKAQNSLYQTKEDIKLLDKLAGSSLYKKYSSLKEAKVALEIEKNTIATLAPRLQKIADLQQSLGQKQSSYLHAKKHLDNLESELNTLEKSLADKEVLQALSLAYSAKGIRLLQIQSLAEAYIQTMNQFSTHIYSMPVKFSAEVGPGMFNIMCERGKLHSDVKYLSGAESRQFLALSALTFCSLMPNHLRSNLLILDEIESGSSPVNVKKFANDFLVFARDYVQNIVVITPYPEENFYIPDAKELLLVRKNNVTSWG